MTMTEMLMMMMMIGSDGKRGALSQVVARIIAAPANENDPDLCNMSRFVLVGSSTFLFLLLSFGTSATFLLPFIPTTLPLNVILFIILTQLTQQANSL